MSFENVKSGSWIQIKNEQLRPVYVIVVYEDGSEHRSAVAINNSIWIRVGTKEPKIYQFGWSEEIESQPTLSVTEMNEKYSLQKP